MMDYEERLAWVAAKREDKAARKIQAKTNFASKLEKLIRCTLPNTPERSRVVFLHEKVSGLKPRLAGRAGVNPRVLEVQELRPALVNADDVVEAEAEASLELAAELEEMLLELNAEYEEAWNEIDVESEESPE